jgi:hypothetical protein
MMSRILTRINLICAFGIAIIAIAASLKFAGVRSGEAWATVAASLAVITSVFSSWSSQRVLELSEDAQKPYPYPSIDLKSRYELMQLRIVNTGGSPAHDIRILWKRPLRHLDGSNVHFAEASDAPDIPVLLPQESTSKLVGVAHEMYTKFENMNYSGELSFTDSSKRRYKIPFYISAESYRSSLIYSQEEPKTHYELQQIPKEIKSLTAEVRSLKEALEKFNNTQSIDQSTS